MKLGELLVRDGRLDRADLDQVIAQQAQEGGRIGSLLVTKELISAETLTVYLGLELGIPIATTATLEKCKRSATRLLTPEQASHFRCIPILIQGQTLTIAIADPHDMQVLDELAMATGYRIIPRVAPEIRIHFFLEYFYGVPQPERFSRLGSQHDVLAADADPLPAPPLPGLPPEVADPVAAPTAAPPIRTTRESKNQRAHRVLRTPAAAPMPRPVQCADTESHQALQLDAADLVEELDAEDDTNPSASSAPDDKRYKRASASATEGRPPAIPIEKALAILAKTKTRSDIPNALLAYAAGVFDVAALLLVRGEVAFGWKGFGPDLDSDRIETLLLPLEASTMLRVALQSDTLAFRGEPFASPLHSHWFRVLRCEIPAISVVIACKIGKRPVNLFYGHNSDGSDISDEQMRDLSTLMQAASSAYVRLISKSKDEAEVDDIEIADSSESSAHEQPVTKDTSSDVGDNAPPED